MNLVRAEWQRFFARRFTRIMLVLIALLLAVIAIGTAHGSQRVTPAVLARAQQQFDLDSTAQQQQLVACENAQTSTSVDPEFQMPPGMTCDEMYGTANGPRLSWFLPRTWTFATDGQTTIVLFGGVLALFGFAVGASFIGAEWHSGGMMNLLLWRPRRVALLAQKLGALLLAVLASGLALGALWALMIWGIVSTRGEMGHMTSGLWQSYALTGARSVALALAATAVGFAIASIGRHTATALGVAVGYVVLIEAGGLILLSMLNAARPERFLLSHYVAAWLLQTQHYAGATVCTGLAGGSSNCVTQGSWAMRPGSAAEVLGILTAALLVWASVSFWRRDVT